MKIASVACLIMFTAGRTLAADGGESAVGTFKSQGITMEIRSAVAYRAKSFRDKGTDALIVAVTNARVRPQAVADYFDRHLAIEKHIKIAQTGVVYLEFDLDGTYRGLSYHLQPGNSCRFCGTEATSRVKLAGRRLSGSLVDRDPERSFDITLNVPVLADEHGSVLGSGGGAPGKAYLAYHAALIKRDRTALKALLSTEQLKTWADTEKKGTLDQFMGDLLSEHPQKSVQVERGFATNEKAVLLISGETQAGRLSGEVILVRENDGWRVDDEIVDLALR
jgi:hypothetical protein